MDRNLDQFKNGLEDLDVSLDENQIHQFLTYYDMLIEKNKVMNLTAITEFDEVVSKHFLDSLALVKAVNTAKKLTILDLGTGAGFPGIPLKIAFPHWKFVLMDSLNKRVLFLQEVIQSLGLTGVEAVHGRAEEMARQKEYRESFDICVSRAVANLASLSEYCIPFIKIGGTFISYKSGEILEELDKSKRAIKLLGGEQKELIEFQIPGTDMGRSLVVIDKKKRTPKLYPRKAGTPSKDPIQ